MSSKPDTTRQTDARIAPWLSVADATAAVEYYKAAFDVTELDRLEDEPGQVVVAHLSIGGADFWIQQDGDSNPQALGNRSPIRLILTVEDPDSVFAQAVGAGATEVVPITEEHGWRVGRIADPWGHHWEVGKPLEPQAQSPRDRP